MLFSGEMNLCWGNLLGEDFFWCSATSRHFLCILFFKDWIIYWYPEPPNSCSWGSKNIWCSMHFGKDIFASWKDYCFYVFVDYICISVNFYVKYYMEKVLQELFWVHFFGCPYHSNSTKRHLDAALWWGDEEIFG